MEHRAMMLFQLVSECWCSYLVSPQFILSLLQLTGRHAPLNVGDVLLQVQQSFPVLINLVRGVPGAVWSSPIGRGSRRLGSHWLRAS